MNRCFLESARFLQRLSEQELAANAATSVYVWLASPTECPATFLGIQKARGT
jgi:hypothetical protein